MNAVTAVVGYPVHAVAAIKAPSRAGGSGVMSWPTPEVPARVASDAEVPAGARRVAMGAIAAGWVVAATYARGTHPGRTPRVVDSLALRMWRHRQRAVAVWQDARFSFAYIWSDEHPIVKHNVTTLRAALGEGVTA